jgi:hypothetical protein
MDVLLRVLVGITLFSAAYLAEIVRGGLQAIPKGQQEAADTLGLSYWQAQRKIILPQALALVVPGIVNNFIGDLQGHLAGDHRQPVRPDRRDGPGAGRRQLAASSSSRPACSRPRSTSWPASRCRATAAGSKRPLHTTGKNRHDPQGPIIEAIITFDKVNKWYGNSFHVLRDIDLSVAKGERIVICGPSGSGKSTLIRCINRLEEHQQGSCWSTASS